MEYIAQIKMPAYNERACCIFCKLLRKRYAIFTDETKTRKTVHTTMITIYGVKHNTYLGNIQSEVNLDDLFAF